MHGGPLRELPSFRALYQLHRNVQTTAEQNTPAEFIANLEEQPDDGNMIAVTVDAKKRSFVVTNSRTSEARAIGSNSKAQNCQVVHSVTE
jgi:hypothetical protein